LYNFLVLQNGVLEYEVFRIAANSGYACLPKISVIINKEGSHKEKEVDLLLLHDSDKISLIEITFRNKIKRSYSKT